MKPSSLSKYAWRREVLGIFEKMKTHGQPYEVTLADKSIVVLPNVFSPKYFTDSLWFAYRLPEIIGENKTLLEIGTGTGIIAVSCALQGVIVTATDVNPDAVRNAQINFERGLSISTRQGNVYDPIMPDEKFDFIFWNHPFNNWEEPVNEMLLRAGLDYKYEGLTEYIKSAHLHLNAGGTLLLGTGNNADIPTIQKLATESGYDLQVLRKETLSLEEGRSVLNDYMVYAFTAAE